MKPPKAEANGANPIHPDDIFRPVPDGVSSIAISGGVLDQPMGIKERRHGRVVQGIIDLGHRIGSHYVQVETVDVTPPQVARRHAAEISFEEKLAALEPAEIRHPNASPGDLMLGD